MQPIPKIDQSIIIDHPFLTHSQTTIL